MSGSNSSSNTITYSTAVTSDGILVEPPVITKAVYVEVILPKFEPVAPIINPTTSK